jgi:tetratricopeptide (TPR) repeat protein
MPDFLGDSLHQRIEALSEEGNNLLESGSFSMALEKFQEAWQLLPEPKQHWEAATWIQAAIGDVHWYTRRYKEASLAFRVAVQCPDGLGNPFIHLRLGQSAFELGDIKQAKDELTRAYMGGGKDIFRDDPKYFELLRDTLIPPAGSETL